MLVCILLLLLLWLVTCCGRGGDGGGVGGGGGLRGSVLAIDIINSLYIVPSSGSQTVYVTA